MTEKNSFLRFLHQQLSVIFILVCVIVICLLTYSHYVGLDDSTHYYMHYEAQTLSEVYKSGDEIIEFDPEIKEYYFSASTLPIALQSYLPLPLNEVHLIERLHQLVYILPYQAETDTPIFYVLHYFENEAIIAEAQWLTVICLLILLSFFIYLYFLGHHLASQLNTFTPWIKQLATQHNPLPLPKNLRFSELLTPLQLLNKIKQENADLLIQQQQAAVQHTLFLQFLAHELRTPIAIQQAAFSRLAQLDDIHEEVWQTIYKAELAAEKMKQLSHRLLLLWQHQPIDSATIDIRASIERTLHGMPPSPHRLQVKYQPHEQLGTVEHNPELWQLLIDNIIQNAAKYSQNGVLNICRQDSKLCFSNQVAMPSDSLQGTAKGESYGVGLFIIKQVCQRLSILLSIEQSADTYQVSLTINK